MLTAASLDCRIRRCRSPTSDPVPVFIGQDEFFSPLSPSPFGPPDFALVRPPDADGTPPGVQRMVGGCNTTCFPCGSPRHPCDLQGAEARRVATRFREELPAVAETMGMTMQVELTELRIVTERPCHFGHTPNVRTQVAPGQVV